jgi:spoIIIJ-associated protein
MAKGKDFYGTTVTEIIAKACKELSASQEDLNIEVLETGSAGIFGLCKKKARIRVTRKVDKEARKEKKADKTEKNGSKPVAETEKAQDTVEDTSETAEAVNAVKIEQAEAEPEVKKPEPAPEKKQPAASRSRERAEKTPQELPTDEVLAAIKEDIVALLEVMTFPSEVTVEIVDHTVACRISGEHDEVLVGNDGRTLDSLQYLLRKMMSRRLPDRMMLSLDVSNYREQRAEDLKARALELAGQVKEDGKTQAIPALNPSERRVVHMVLQEDKAIRSRSVGEGLFKKVLIYKPGKKKKSGSGKGKGRKSGHSSGNQ